MARESNLERDTRYQGLRDGIRKHWAPADRIRIDGKLWAPQELIDVLQSLIDAMRAADAAHANWMQQLSVRTKLERRWNSLLRLLEQVVQVRHASDVRTLAEFGREERKKTGPKTPQAKVAMVEKAKATRALRGTMGKRQRRKIKAGG